MSHDTDYSVHRPAAQHEVTGLIPVARQDDATKRRNGTAANGKRRGQRPTRRTQPPPSVVQEPVQTPQPEANGQSHEVDCLA
jgi:hypothetical protein